MNKILLSTVAVSLLSTIVYAGPKIEVTPMVGKKIYNYSDDAPRFDDGEALIGVRGNVYVSDRVSVQVGAEASKDNAMGDGGKTDIERGMLNLQYDIPSKGKITPFVMGGAGYEKLHRTYAAENVDSQAFYNAGAGLRYNVNDKVDLVAEARVIHKVEDQDTDAIGSVGVGFKYGGGDGYQAKSKGIPVKALSVQELAALTPKKAAPVAPVAPAVVAPAPVESVTPVESEVVDTRIEYDSGYVDMCGSTASVESASETVSDVVDGYYVQVIALRKNSPDAIAARLDAKGYNYTLKQEGDLTRVLVGPYESRSAARGALRGLKRIRRDAFIYHVQ